VDSTHWSGIEDLVRNVLARRKPWIGLDAARHSYAGTALRAGARLDLVSRQLGHASIATTAIIYLHDSDDSAIEAAELLGRIWRE